MSINGISGNQGIQALQAMRKQATQMAEKMHQGTSIQTGASTSEVQGSKSSSFADMFENAVTSVNEAQKTSSSLKTAYALGDKTVSLSDVVVASQSSKVQFEALMQVRNRFIDAYKEVMNMQL